MRRLNRSAQAQLFPVTAGRYDPVDEVESAAYGRALLAKVRGDELTPAQRAVLTPLAHDPPADERAPTPVVDESTTLLTLDRGDDAEVRVSWRRYKGSSHFLDIRRWEAGSSGMRPTRQGVSIRMRELPRFLKAVLLASRLPAGAEPPRAADAAPSSRARTTKRRSRPAAEAGDRHQDDD